MLYIMCPTTEAAKAAAQLRRDKRMLAIVIGCTLGFTTAAVTKHAIMYWKKSS